MSQWHVIALEALALPEEGWQPDGWREPGDALWPERWDREKLEAIRASDAKVWMTNYQQRPIAGGACWFSPAELGWYEKINVTEMNVYIIVDPALRKNKRADPTVMGVFGLGIDRNIYWLEVIREWVEPTERSALLFGLHKKWAPLSVGYEEYGLQSDVVTLKEKMERDGYRFRIVELGRAGDWHMLSKEDRIRTLQPIGKAGRLWLPKHATGANAACVQYFVEKEWALYCGPKTTQYDDVLDMMSRINDPSLGAVFPVKVEYGTPDLHWHGTSYLSA